MHHSYGKRKAEVAAPRLDTLKKCHASPTVLSEELFQCFVHTSLESHESAPLFAAVMRGYDCDTLLCPLALSSLVVMTSSDMSLGSALTTPQPSSITPSLSSEESLE